MRLPPLASVASAFVRAEDGATAVEYALLVALIGATAIVGMQYFGVSLQTMITRINDTFTTATGA